MYLCSRRLCPGDLELIFSCNIYWLQVGLPHELDKELNTVGLSDFGGAADSSIADTRVCAHYRIFEEEDGSSRLCGAVINGEGFDGKVSFVEFDEDFKLLNKRTFTIPGSRVSILHDMSVTENYYILVDNKLNFDFWKFLTEYIPGQASFVSCTSLDASTRKIYLVPRPGRANRGPYCEWVLFVKWAVF